MVWAEPSGGAAATAPSSQPQPVHPADVDMTATQSKQEDGLLTKEQWIQQRQAASEQKKGSQGAYEERRLGQIFDGRAGRLRVWMPEDGFRGGTSEGDVQVGSRSEQFAK